MSGSSRLAIAVAVGFLGASQFAWASGMIQGGVVSEYAINVLTLVSGIILFVLTLSLIGPFTRLVRSVLDALSRVEERPGPAVALGMLGLGTLCAITAMLVQYSALSSQSKGVAMNVHNTSFIVQYSGSFGLGVLTILSFLLGASMIGLGIWASLKPASASTRPAHAIKPKAPEFDETIA
jgi:hypothetical protein